MKLITTAPRRMASHVLRPLLRRAARAYVAGEHLADAISTLDRLNRSGISGTLGFWDGPTDSPRGVADHYLAAVEALAGRDAYLSIKPPALGLSSELTGEVAQAAASTGVRLHCDSHGVDVADKTIALAGEILSAGAAVSLTLPGRWQRCLADAQWAIEQGAAVRVVKGQWSDPADPDRDMSAGFLELIDRLAGQAKAVDVATHDVPLALEAIRRLKAAGTPYTWELLHGLPMKAALRLASEQGIPVRVYVPYGAAYLPYALGKLQCQPRIAWWLLRDLLTRN
jgi:proline dehydrogenase